MKPCFDKKKEPAHITKETHEDVILDLASDCVKNCGKCCNNGSGFLVGDDKTHIANYLGLSKAELKSKFLDEVRVFNQVQLRPKLKKDNSCVFLTKDMKCKVQGVKPYQCRTSTLNQHSKQINDWFTLNFLVDAKDKKSVKEWNVRAKLFGSIPGGRPEDLQ